MRSVNSGLTAFFLVILAVGAFGLVLWLNANNSAPIAPVLPTESLPTNEVVSISQLLDSNFGSGATALPTIEIPNIQATRAIVAQSADASPTPIRASDLNNQGDVAALPVGSTPTLPPPTAIVPVARGTTNPEDWAIPPLQPGSADAQGRDHYWFLRPIESNANNLPLSTYVYGAGGYFGSRIHHGIDIPNVLGQTVYAAQSGTVIFASDGRSDGTFDLFQNTAAYGNVVFIRHDFGINGRPIYTLYAHLQAAVVTEGQYVQAGDPIALVGETGQVSGPHVHFEIRIGDGENLPRYGDTYNPVLWMVSYVGHGVVAGRVLDTNGVRVDNVTVTLRNRSVGARSTTTYIFQDTVDDVNPDPIWNENFAFNDVPVGRYDVIATINEQRVVGQVDVLEGRTNIVELRQPAPQAPATETNDG